jgi:hypothetical protein
MKVVVVVEKEKEIHFWALKKVDVCFCRFFSSNILYFLAEWFF